MPSTETKLSETMEENEFATCKMRIKHPSVIGAARYCPECGSGRRFSDDVWRDLHYFQVHILKIPQDDIDREDERASLCGDEGMYDGPMGQGMHFFAPDQYCEEPSHDAKEITKVTDELRKHWKLHSHEDAGAGWKLVPNLEALEMKNEVGIAATEDKSMAVKYTDELIEQQQPHQSTGKDSQYTGMKLISELTSKLAAIATDDEWEIVAISEKAENELGAMGSNQECHESYDSSNYTNSNALAEIRREIEISETEEEGKAAESRISRRYSWYYFVERLSEIAT